MGALMERTRPTEIGSDALETDVLADHLDDVGGVAHLVDDFVGYHPSSTTVTPAPPSFQAPSRKLVTRVSLRSISATRSRKAPVPLPWMMRRVLRSARTAASTACIRCPLPRQRACPASRSRSAPGLPASRPEW